MYLWAWVIASVCQSLLWHLKAARRISNYIHCHVAFKHAIGLIVRMLCSIKGGNNILTSLLQCFLADAAIHSANQNYDTQDPYSHSSCFHYDSTMICFSCFSWDLLQWTAGGHGRGRWVVNSEQPLVVFQWPTWSYIGPMRLHLIWYHMLRALSWMLWRCKWWFPRLPYSCHSPSVNKQE